VFSNGGNNMGLISKTVLIKWEWKTRNYYESLGYNFTKIKDVFEVNINHLPKYSRTKVEVSCDNCGCIKLITFNQYNKFNKNGIYYCKRCALRLYGGKNLAKAKLKDSKSFEQWCIEHNRQDVLARWDYELNQCKPSEICYSTMKKYYFKCLSNKNHISELKSINDFTNNHEGSIACKQCNSFAQWGIDNIGKDFLEKYWDYDKNTISPWEISYGTRTKKVWIKCQEKDYHDSYAITPLNFINGGRCQYCTNHRGKVHPMDSLGYLHPEVLKIWADKNKKSPYEYAPMSNEKAWFKCSEGKHSDTYRVICNANQCNFICPECVRERDESFLQEKVRLYLKDLGYNILHEDKCTLKCYNPTTNHLLRYDNEIVELKLIIEVNGIQHYQITNFHVWSSKRFNTTPEYELKSLQERDKFKKEFALANNYSYLEIPYWADDKNETWKDLINKKIDEIKNKNIISRQELIVV
jgi:hypothetical protein